MNGNYCHDHERYMPCRKCQDKRAYTQGIVRSSIHAYNAGKRWEDYEPGYTDHEAMAWEIGRAEVEKEKRA